MIFIHIADIHASRERYECVKEALDAIIIRTLEGDVDAVLIAGDFFDSTITVSDSSHYTDFLELVSLISKNTKVIFVYGTPSHENNGVLYPFTMIENVTVLMDTHNNPYAPSFMEFDNFEVIGLPEPRMSELDGKTVDEKSASYKAMMSKFIAELPKKKNTRIVIGHGDIEGTFYQNGQKVSSGPFTLNTPTLRKLDGDYYAWGHIHQPQQLNGLQGRYAGSLVPLNYGECHDAGYIIVEL